NSQELLPGRSLIPAWKSVWTLSNVPLDCLCHKNRQGRAQTIKPHRFMRILRLFILATITAFIAGSASAQLVIYKGTLKQSGTGQGVSIKLTSKLYVIVDHNTGHTAEIQYVSVNNSKMYDTDTETNLHIVQISGPKGKNIEALSQAANACDISEGNTNDLVI